MAAPGGREPQVLGRAGFVQRESEQRRRRRHGLLSMPFKRGGAMEHDLSGKVALVTGAAIGIGRGIALALGGAGATVGLHYHASRAEAEHVAAELTQRGVATFLLPADLTIEEQANAVVDRLVEQAGRLDILVNN